MKYWKIKTSKKAPSWVKQSSRGGYSSDSQLHYGRNERAGEKAVEQHEEFNPKVILIKHE